MKIRFVLPHVTFDAIRNHHWTTGHFLVQIVFFIQLSSWQREDRDKANVHWNESYYITELIVLFTNKAAMSDDDKVLTETIYFFEEYRFVSCFTFLVPQLVWGTQHDCTTQAWWYDGTGTSGWGLCSDVTSLWLL